jgi:hypothetical protein
MPPEPHCPLPLEAEAQTHQPGCEPHEALRCHSAPAAISTAERAPTGFIDFSNVCHSPPIRNTKSPTGDLELNHIQIQAAAAHLRIRHKLVGGMDRITSILDRSRSAIALRKQLCWLLTWLHNVHRQLQVPGANSPSTRNAPPDASSSRNESNENGRLCVVHSHRFCAAE